MTGVQTRTVAPDEADIRLDRWFKRHFPQLNHVQLEKLLRTGQVRVDGGRAKASTRLAGGQSIRVPPLQADAAQPVKGPRPVSPREAETLRALVLHRDPDVLVIDKPYGLAVQGGTGTSKHLDAMLDALRFDAPERPRLVHRLDKDTSGVLVLARNAFAAQRLADAFRSRDTLKVYWAVVAGVPKPHRGRIDLPLAKTASPRGERVAADREEGQTAFTDYTVVEHAHRSAAWVALWPRTGRTHQLRVHMAAIGTPILGDGKYGADKARVEGADLPDRLHLHARRIVVPHPRGGRVDVTAPLPPHMRRTWDWFGFSPDTDGNPFEEIM
ncbi:MAG: RluA family pseudouridine synthase [Rhodospirillales bacterium]|jgi:23S rRNA pseudouridine955/2504/2580 synthase